MAWALDLALATLDVLGTDGSEGQLQNSLRISAPRDLRVHTGTEGGGAKAAGRRAP